MSLSPKITKDTNGVYWLEYDPDLACDGYQFSTPGGSSRTFNNAVAKIKLGTGWPTPFTVHVQKLHLGLDAPEDATYPPVTVPVPPPSKLPRFGISTGAEIVVHTPADRDRELDAIKKLNAEMVRFDHWGDSKSDAVAAACWTRGMAPMMTIFGTDKSPRTNPGQLAGQVAARYTKQPVRIYEICNEPDLNGWTPNVYAPFAKAAADQILAADPGAKIWCGGNFKGGDQAGKTPPDFVKALISAGVKFHAYSGHHFDDAESWNDPRNGWRYAATIRQLLDAAGLQAVQIVSSETHCGGADQAQASAVQSRMQQVKDGKVAATCFYRMRPEGDRPDFAFLRADWSERPACQTFRSMVA